MRLPIPKLMQPPPGVSCSEKPGFRGRSQLCGELGGSDHLPDTILVQKCFQCSDEVMRGVWLVVSFPEVCGWNDFCSRRARTWADSSLHPFTLAAASTSLRPSPPPSLFPLILTLFLCIGIPGSCLISTLNSLPPCSSQ